MSDERISALMLFSNAEQLVAGEGVESVRRRFKQMSVASDVVMLEMGVRHILAGSEMSSHRFEPGRDGEVIRDVQTLEDRSVAQASGLALEVEPGPRSRAQGRSERWSHDSTADIVWAPNLAFFLDELPPTCRWVSVFFVPKGLPPEVRTRADSWARLDRENPVLVEELPTEFARYAVTDGLNHDLLVAQQQGFALSVDPLHQRVLDARWGPASTWEGHGAALNILYPFVGDLDWNSVQSIRELPAIEDFRRRLDEFERESRQALEAGGDPVSVLHLNYQKHLAASQPRLADRVNCAVTSILAGTAASIYTMNHSMPVQLAAGAAVGIATLVNEVVADRQGWLSCDLAIRDRAAGPPRT